MTQRRRWSTHSGDSPHNVGAGDWIIGGAPHEDRRGKRSPRCCSSLRAAGLTPIHSGSYFRRVNRRAPILQGAEALRRFQELRRSERGFRLMLTQLPPGTTIEEARTLRRKIIQSGRTPCSFLDREYGIER